MKRRVRRECASPVLYSDVTPEGSVMKYIASRGANKQLIEIFDIVREPGPIFSVLLP